MDKYFVFKSMSFVIKYINSCYLLLLKVDRLKVSIFNQYISFTVFLCIFISWFKPSHRGHNYKGSRLQLKYFYFIKKCVSVNLILFHIIEQNFELFQKIINFWVTTQL